MKRKILFFLPVLLAMANISCSNSENDSQEKLTTATLVGANNAGCYIDGKLFIPKDG